MALNRLVLFCVGIGFVAFIGSAQIAQAGGCSRQPQPGDHLNCGHNGPHGPSGPNYVQCRSQCTALKNCLNSRPTPPANCNTEQQALNQCMIAGGAQPLVAPPGAGGASGSNATRITVGFEPGVGCFLVNSGTAFSFNRKASASSTRQAYEYVPNFVEVECLLASSDMPYEVAHQQSSEMMMTVISKRLGVSSARLTSGADLYSDLGASWGDMRAVANDFEQLFSVKVPDEVINNLNTVGDVINCAQQASIAGVF